MKFLILSIMFFVCSCLFSQELEGVYYKYNPKRIVFHGLIPRTTPKHYIYLYLKKDSSIVYINTIGALGRGMLVLNDKYIIIGDSIYFEKNFGSGILKNDNIYIPIYAFYIKKANLSDVDKFIEKYRDYLISRNICFKNGYAILCDSIISH